MTDWFISPLEVNFSETFLQWSYFQKNFPNRISGSSKHPSTLNLTSTRILTKHTVTSYCSLPIMRMIKKQKIKKTPVCSKVCLIIAPRFPLVRRVLSKQPTATILYHILQKLCIWHLVSYLLLLGFIYFLICCLDTVSSAESEAPVLESEQNQGLVWDGGFASSYLRQPPFWMSFSSAPYRKDSGGV